MTLLIVLAVIALLAGPILMAMPSRRERALAALREDARRRGFTLQVTQLDHPAPALEQRVSAGGVTRRPMIDCVAYRLPRRAAAAGVAARGPALDIDEADDTLASAASAPALTRSRVLRRRDARTAELPAGWVVDSGFAAPDTAVLAVLPTLGDDIVAVESTHSTVALYWLERGGSARLGELDAVLRGLLAAQQANASFTGSQS